tara:strand:- start:9531 stop:10202 length:672 start_codon:yes stop_codon:yes gene_type:complete
MCEKIAKRLNETRHRIDIVAQNVGRNNSDITLIAVSKGQSDARIDSAIKLGQRVYGENRVQEAQKHWVHRRKLHNNLELHLIGPLQTNKVDLAVELFDTIQTVDRPKLVHSLIKTFQKKGVTRKCFVQINTGEEDQKSGIWPEDADNFISFCRSEGLPLIGLMCIPPVSEPVAPHFALLKKIGERNNISSLSMGMSSDFETAVSLGATHVRVGTGVFGRRENH